MGGHCYQSTLCSPPMLSTARAITLPHVPMSGGQSGKRGGQTEAEGCKASSLALMVPMPPAALTPVLPGQQILRDMKITYPGSSCLRSNQSKEFLFLNSAPKTYNSKEQRLWGWERPRGASERGVWKNWRQGWGEARRSHYLSTQGEERPRTPAQSTPCS